MRQLNQTQRFAPSLGIPFRAFLDNLLVIFEKPLWAAVIGLLGYGLFAAISIGPRLFDQSTAPYFVYLADALLHGQLALRSTPPSTNDLSLYDGNLYLYWGPLPALIFLPFVAIFGLSTSDVFVTVLLGALNVSLVAVLLRYASIRGIARLTRQQRGLLVLFFAFGTVHFTLAPHGSVWATGQVVAVLCVLLTYIFALSLRGWKAFALCGVAIMGAFLTRNHTLFAGIWPAIYLLLQHRNQGWRQLAMYIVVGFVPLAVGGGALLAYNYLRFGSPFDNGLAYHKMSWFFLEDYKRYGVFNWHYIPTNIYYQYVFYPIPFRAESLMGGSLFLLSPVFFAVIAGVIQNRHKMNVWLLVCSIAVVSIPILLLMGTGWVQFGPRYTLDFHVPLLLLTALGIRHWRVRTVFWLTLISIAHYAYGTYMLG